MNLLADANIWVLISFVIFVVGAYRLGKDKVLHKIDSRIDEIQKDIATAESLRIEAQELLAQYQRKQKDAAKEAEKIISTAQTHADQILVDAQEEIKNMAKRREQNLSDRLKRMEESAIQEIQAHAAALAVEATKEIIAKNMDAKINEKLLDKSMDDLTSQLN